MFLFLIFWVFIVGSIIYGIKNYNLIKNEQKAFENMIMNSNNNTVAQYIQALKDCDKLLNKHNVLETRIRLSQGFIEISENANISAELKEQLKTYLMIKGVPI